MTCFSSWTLDDCPFEGHSKLLMPERPFSFFQFSFPYLLYPVSLLLIYVTFYVVLFSCFINSSLCSPSPDSPPRLLCLAASLSMLRFRQLFAKISVRTSFGHDIVCTGSVVEQLAVGKIFSRVLRFTPVSIIPLMFPTQSFSCHQRYGLNNSVVK